MNKDHEIHELAHKEFWQGMGADSILKKQAISVMESYSCDCQPDFLGFLGQYYYLSHLIPQDRVIYDMGCCYGFQSWFFRNHKKYIGVDLLSETNFTMPNSEYYHMPIEDFIANHEVIAPHFAICNYVPPWHGDNEKMVKDAFRDVFVYYPQNIKDSKRLFKGAKT